VISRERHPASVLVWLRTTHAIDSVVIEKDGELVTDSKSMIQNFTLMRTPASDPHAVRSSSSTTIVVSAAATATSKDEEESLGPNTTSPVTYRRKSTTSLRRSAQQPHNTSPPPNEMVIASTSTSSRSATARGGGKKEEPMRKEKAEGNEDQEASTSSSSTDEMHSSTAVIPPSSIEEGIVDRLKTSDEKGRGGSSRVDDKDKVSDREILWRGSSVSIETDDDGSEDLDSEGRPLQEKEVDIPEEDAYEYTIRLRVTHIITVRLYGTMKGAVVVGPSRYVKFRPAGAPKPCELTSFCGYKDSIELQFTIPEASYGSHQSTVGAVSEESRISSAVVEMSMDSLWTPSWVPVCTVERPSIDQRSPPSSSRSPAGGAGAEGGNKNKPHAGGAGAPPLVWTALMLQLKEHTSYKVRIRGVNTIGLGSPGIFTIRTATFPLSPLLRQARRFPSHVVVHVVPREEPMNGEKVCKFYVARSGFFSYEEIPHTMEKVSGLDVVDVDVVGANNNKSETTSTKQEDNKKGEKQENQGDKKVKDIYELKFAVPMLVATTVSIWSENALGRSADPSVITVHPSTIPPPPTLTKVAKSPHTVNLSWAWVPSEGTTFVACEGQVSRDTAFGGWEFMAMPPSPEGGVFEVARLQKQTTYLFRARVKNEVGWSVWSNPITAQTSDPPPRPTKVELVDVVVRGFTLRVDATSSPEVPITSMTADVVHTLSTVAAKITRRDEHFLEFLDLEPDTDYNIAVWVSNVVGRCEKPFFINAGTAKRPKEVEEVSASSTPSEVTITFSPENPRGAPITGCFIEYSTLFTRWIRVPCERVESPETSEVESNEDTEGKAIDKGREKDSWTVSLLNLKHLTEYKFRIQCANICGMGAFSTIFNVKTLDLPSPPVNLEQVQTHLCGITIRCDIEQPTLGSIEDVIAECSVHGVFTAWEIFRTTMTLVEESQTHLTYNVLVEGLEPEMMYSLRLYSSNAWNFISYPSQVLVCKTCTKPAMPTNTGHSQVTPFGATFRWQVEDPPGLHCTHSILQISERSMFGKWTESSHPVTSDPDPFYPTLHQCDCTRDTLLHDTQYVFRICVVNHLGMSPFSEQDFFKTSGHPGKPCDIKGGKARVQWKIADPDGARVTGCIIKLHTSGITLFGYRVRDDDIVWEATMPFGEQKVTIRPFNCVGFGEDLNVSLKILKGSFSMPATKPIFGMIRERMIELWKTCRPTIEEELAERDKLWLKQARDADFKDDKPSPGGRRPIGVDGKLSPRDPKKSRSETEQKNVLKRSPRSGANTDVTVSPRTPSGAGTRPTTPEAGVVDKEEEGEETERKPSSSSQIQKDSKEGEPNTPSKGSDGTSTPSKEGKKKMSINLPRNDGGLYNTKVSEENTQKGEKITTTTTDGIHPKYDEAWKTMFAPRTVSVGTPYSAPISTPAVVVTPRGSGAGTTHENRVPYVKKSERRSSVPVKTDRYLQQQPPTPSSPSSEIPRHSFVTLEEPGGYPTLRTMYSTMEEATAGARLHSSTATDVSVAKKRSSSIDGRPPVNLSDVKMECEKGPKVSVIDPECAWREGDVRSFLAFEAHHRGDHINASRLFSLIEDLLKTEIEVNMLWDELLERNGSGDAPAGSDAPASSSAPAPGEKTLSTELLEQQILWRLRWGNLFGDVWPEILMVFERALYGKTTKLKFLTGCIQCLLEQQTRLDFSKKMYGEAMDAAQILGPGSTTDKVQQTIIGLLIGIVLPIPGALEVWAITTSMMWLDDRRMCVLAFDSFEALEQYGLLTPSEMDCQDTIALLEADPTCICMCNFGFLTINVSAEEQAGALTTMVDAHPLGRKFVDAISLAKKNANADEDCIPPGSFCSLTKMKGDVLRIRNSNNDSLGAVPMPENRIIAIIRADSCIRVVAAQDYCATNNAWCPVTVRVWTGSSSMFRSPLSSKQVLPGETKILKIDFSEGSMVVEVKTEDKSEEIDVAFGHPCCIRIDGFI